MVRLGPAAAPALHVMSWNIRRRVRYPNPRKADRWTHRAPRLRALLQAEQPTVLGVQEALADQATFLLNSLGTGYRFVGHGRNADGRGEGNPIVFDSTRLELLDWDQQALSTTPSKPGSRSWGTVYPRVLVSARFRDRATGSSFVVINTHLDHLSARSRAASARLIRDQAAGSEIPVVITGDLNATPASEPIRLLLGGDRLVDTWAAAAQQRSPAWDTLATYRTPIRSGRRVDWILASSSLGVEAAAINAEAYDGGWASDHLPVQALLRIPGGRR